MEREEKPMDIFIPVFFACMFVGYFIACIGIARDNEALFSTGLLLLIIVCIFAFFSLEAWV